MSKTVSPPPSQPSPTAAPSEGVADWRRLCAFLLDAATALALCAALRALTPSPAYWLGLLYLVGKDAIGGGRSLGKRILNLNLVLQDDGGHRLAALLLRNVTLIPPVLLVELLVAAFAHDQRRIGDVLAHTALKPGSSRPRPRTTAPRRPPQRTAARPQQPVPKEVKSSPAQESRSPDSPSKQPTASAPPAPPRALSPHEVLGIEKGADEDAIEDAYWHFMDRYSEDAIKDIDGDELAQRCRELADRFETLTLTCASPVVYGESLPVEHKREFVHQFVIAVNAARDKLLAPE